MEQINGLDPKKEIKYLTPEEVAAGKQGYILAPYKILTTKVIVYDKDGKHVYWQINKRMRFKLWLHKLFYKSKKLKAI